MRHRKGNRKLGLTTDQRLALIKNGTKSLLEHKQIKTTHARAKEISKFAENLITIAKKEDLAARRHVLKLINDKRIMSILFKEILPKYKDRNGGYTRVIRYGIRRGDAAIVSVLELV